MFFEDEWWHLNGRICHLGYRISRVKDVICAWNRNSIYNFVHILVSPFCLYLYPHRFLVQELGIKSKNTKTAPGIT
jgi:hypothetical protein